MGIDPLHYVPQIPINIRRENMNCVIVPESESLDHVPRAWGLRKTEPDEISK
jgi:hypothetical protein